MKKYIIRLYENYNESIAEQLKNDNIYVIFSGGVLKDLIIIETDKSFDELKNNKLFRKIEKERIGTIYI